MKNLLLFIFLPIAASSQSFTSNEIAEWRQQSKNVTIIRDTWGVPHIYGKTDADAVFGLLYVECEEDFPRVERNYLEVLGRLSEVDGKTKLLQDIQMQLIYDTSAAKRDYDQSPAWFKKLLDAFAAGVNFYLANHPETHPKVLTRFEPWLPLMYTDGSISATQMGGATEADTKELYAKSELVALRSLNDQFHNRDQYSGSNGFAIGPRRSESGSAMLYINPHVTFYFRTEVQLVSDEGLNVYGAVTWGQFFVYQGFNAHCGWMHTSSYADVSDLYEEDVVHQNERLYYRYEGGLKQIATRPLVIPVRKGNAIDSFHVSAYFTHHGPVIGIRAGKWLSLKEHNRSYNALIQSWSRTKATGFEEFRQIMDLRSNNSNNTVYADDQGNIAYWHGNFIPVRDTAFDWTMPVDGTSTRTEWKGLHQLNEIVHMYNPSSGWIQNCNSTPFTAAGESSPVRSDYPSYMAPDGQNPRALNAMRLLKEDKKLTLDGLIKVGYDHYVSAFAILLPQLVKAYEELTAADPQKKELTAAIAVLKKWDYYVSEQSVATTIAISWGNLMWLKLPHIKTEEKESDQVALLYLLSKRVSTKEQLSMLSEALKGLSSKYGNWKIEWGEINRYQRTSSNITQVFDDRKPGIAVGMVSSRWGCLPAFESRPSENNNKLYGYSGNSFIAAVEFGTKLRAKTIVTGGQSSDPASLHFTDQAPGYVNGKLKDIFFYKQDVLAHAEKTYHPGDAN